MPSSSHPKAPRFGLGAKLLFAVCTVGLLLAGIELALRAVYFQKKGSTATAIEGTLEHLRVKRNQEQANKLIAQWNLPEIELLEEALHQAEARPLLLQIQQQYEESFLQLQASITAKNARFMVMYVPSWSSQAAEQGSRAFFTDLCQRHEVPILDLSEPLLSMGQEMATLNPVDFHLSRAGHILIADALMEQLPPFLGDHRSGVAPTTGVRLFGDLIPSQERIDSTKGTMPHRVAANSAGLRMDYELDEGKVNQRILFLGDSFTYGMYVHNHETFVGHLRGRDQSREYVNAGLPGYTITQQRDLFIERAQHLGSDLVVLQVLDNDLIGLLSFLKVSFARRGEDTSGYVATEEEKAFLKFASEFKSRSVEP